MPTSTTSYTLQESSVLMEDYIITNNVLINPGQPNQVAPFYGAGGDLQMLVITGGDANNLAWVSQDPGSAGGWSIYYFPGVSGVTQVVAAVQNGVVVAIYQDAAGSHGLTYDFSGNSWDTKSSMPGYVDTIRACVNPDTGEVTFYGLIPPGEGLNYPVFQLLIYDNGQDSFLCYTEDAVSANIFNMFPGSSYFLQYFNNATQFGYIICLNFSSTIEANGMTLTSYEVGVFQAGVFADATNGNTFSIPYFQIPELFYQNNPTPLAIQQILGIYAGNTDPGPTSVNYELLFQSADQHLYTLVNQNSQPIDTGLIFQSASVNEGNLLTVFGISNDGTLSSLWQTGVDENNLPVWAPPIPVAVNISSVYCAYVNQGLLTDIAAVDINGNLQWCNSSAAGWTFSYVQVPPDETTGALQVSHYQTEINITDANSCPAAGVPIVITASSLTGITNRGKTYVTGPDPTQQLTLYSDNMGKLSFSSLAYAITANGVTISTPDGTSLSIAPDQQLTAYFTSGITLNNLAPISPATLVAATDSAGNPLLPGIQGESGSALAGPVTAALQNTFALWNASNGSIVNPQTGQTITGYSLDMTDPSNTNYTEYNKPGEAAAARMLIRNRWSLVKKGKTEESILGDLDHLAHDVWHGIKSGATAVSHWIVDVENNLVTIVSNDINDAIELALDDLESIGSVAHSIFNAVGADVEKVVEWLRFMFDWQDILNTRDAIQQNILGSFGSITNVLQSAKTQLDNFFTKQETAVTDLLNNYITSMNGKSIADLGNAPSPSFAKAASLKGATANPPINASLFNNDPKHNWLLNKTLDAFSGGFTMTSYESALSTPFSNLITQFSTSYQDFCKAATAFINAELQSAGSDPKSYMDRGVTDILTGLKALIPDLLQLIDDIIDLIIDLITAVISIADDALNMPLDQLPVIGVILQGIEKVSGVSFGDLTLTSLVSLLIAIPVTLAYKLINGSQAQPFPQATMGKSTKSAVPANEAIGFVYTGMSAFNTLCTTIADLFPPNTSVPRPIQFFLVVPQVGSQAFCFPPGYTSPLTLNTTADWTNTCSWLWGWVPITRSFATACLPDTTLEPFADPALLFLDTVLSGIQLGWNIAGMAGKLKDGESENAADIASVFVNPAPGFFALLRSQVLFGADTGELNIALKVLLDFFLGGAAVVLDGYEAVEG